MEYPNSIDMDRVKAEVCEALFQDAAGYLDRETLKRRLVPLREARVLDASELAEEVHRKIGSRIPEDKVGGVILFDGEDKLGKVALLEATDDEMEAYHTAAHEGIHLLGPDSKAAYPGWDWMDRYAIHESLGPMSTSFTFDEDGSVAEVSKIPEEEKIFWEAATDYVAAQHTAEKFGQAAVDEKIARGEGAGFIQRYWIEFLIEQHPNPEELSGAMRAALYQGSGKMSEFLRGIGGRLDNPQVPFYHTLTYYMNQGEQALNAGDGAAYRKALDAFMEDVQSHFSSGGAYSLDMTNF